MTIDISKGLFLSDGCVVSKNVLLIAAGFNSDPDQESSRVIFNLEGQWRHFDIEVDAVISATANGNLGYVIASNGSAFEIPLASDITHKEVGDKIRSWVIESAVDFGELTRVRSIAGIPHCCGQSGQIYRLAKSKWVRADHGLRSNEGPSIEDIDGFNSDDLYVVGLRGSMHHFDGAKWRQIELPTNLNLSNIRCGSDGVCYACGDSGLLLKGRGDSWSIVGDLEVDKNYWGLDIFQGEVYLSHSRGIDRLDGNEIVALNIGVADKITFNRIHSFDNQLWSFGTDNMLKFEDNSWTSIEIPLRN